MTPQPIAIAGGSGVVGTHAVRLLLDRPEVSRLSALGRRALAVTHPKLVSSVVDFTQAEQLRTALPEGLAAAFCCLGTTIKQAGSKDAFRAIDHDAVLSFARAARGRGAEAFLLISSVGASANSSNFYLRTKGETERDLEQLSFERLTILRPSFIDDAGTRHEHRLGERLALPVARAVFSVVGKTHRYAPISAEVIARAMVALCFDGEAQRIRVLESNTLHSLGEKPAAAPSPGTA